MNDEMVVCVTTQTGKRWTNNLCDRGRSSHWSS